MSARTKLATVGGLCTAAFLASKTRLVKYASLTNRSISTTTAPHLVCDSLVKNAGPFLALLTSESHRHAMANAVVVLGSASYEWG